MWAVGIGLNWLNCSRRLKLLGLGFLTTMDDALSFTEDDRDNLVLIVKSAHQLKICGSKGEWTDFLAARGLSRAVSDPERHKWQVLAEFVRTFDNEMVKRLKRWRKRLAIIKLVEASDPWSKTPEQCLVDRTYEHPLFFTSYHFPSFLPGWKCTKRGSSSDASYPERLLSLDCEMVMCEGYEQQVVQVCIVDRNNKTVLDTLVKPSKKVIDYITHIHGLEKKDIAQATCTQEEIQKEVAKLLEPGTILVGHSVFYDLKALKIDHRRVIDTSMLFRLKGLAMISLQNLCKAVLGYDFRETGTHKCIDDAIVPMKLILHQLEHGTIDVKINFPSSDPCRLLIHKMSHRLIPDELRRIVAGTIPCTIEKVEGKKGQMHVVFESKLLANRAFELLSGEAGQDSGGFEQKSVTQWRKGLYLQLRVRKLAHSSEEDHPSITPKKRELETTAVESKRLKQQPDRIDSRAEVARLTRHKQRPEKK
ncbi:putative small RNA degrading nuclease 4 [Selaginella moellendorffii]|uniref:putative small RNA degrading nuclease 4 n=1 Tax=Selaginella moellendorffii TaxID=88036 RepID=UPI000D1C5718|nr:putative small RNA degrading nuclease 4 [Selaginella moellendorffii]|eukprot:XP_024530949.1 putative small RNA degrading nuclease 4 [Selaginella moellendorffii]